MSKSRYYEPVPHLEAIFPTPLCLIAGEKDFLASPDLIAAVYARAMEPKSLKILKGGHFDGFQGEGFEIASTTAVKWFEKYQELRNCHMRSPAKLKPKSW